MTDSTPATAPPQDQPDPPALAACRGCGATDVALLRGYCAGCAQATHPTCATSKAIHLELRRAQQRVEELSVALRQAIRAEISAGVTRADIASDLGISRARVHQLLEVQR